MKKKTKMMIKGVMEQGRILLILLSIVFLVYCVMQFFLSWHTIDLAWNIQILTNQINSAGLYTGNGTQIIIPFEKVMDTGSDFVSRPLVNYYISSSNNLRKYFIWGLLDMLLLGFLLGGKL